MGKISLGTPRLPGRDTFRVPQRDPGEQMEADHFAGPFKKLLSYCNSIKCNRTELKFLYFRGGPRTNEPTN